MNGRRAIVIDAVGAIELPHVQPHTVLLYGASESATMHYQQLLKKCWRLLYSAFTKPTQSGGTNDVHPTEHLWLVAGGGGFEIFLSLSLLSLMKHESSAHERINESQSLAADLDALSKSLLAIPMALATSMSLAGTATIGSCREITTLVTSLKDRQNQARMESMGNRYGILCPRVEDAPYPTSTELFQDPFEYGNG